MIHMYGMCSVKQSPGILTEKYLFALKLSTVKIFLMATNIKIEKNKLLDVDDENNGLEMSCNSK